MNREGGGGVHVPLTEIIVFAVIANAQLCYKTSSTCSGSFSVTTLDECCNDRTGPARSFSTSNTCQVCIVGKCANYLTLYSHLSNWVKISVCL